MLIHTCCSVHGATVANYETIIRRRRSQVMKCLLNLHHRLQQVFLKWAHCKNIRNTRQWMTCRYVKRCQQMTKQKIYVVIEIINIANSMFKIVDMPHRATEVAVETWHPTDSDLCYCYFKTLLALLTHLPINKAGWQFDQTSLCRRWSRPVAIKLQKVYVHTKEKVMMLLQIQHTFYY